MISYRQRWTTVLNRFQWEGRIDWENSTTEDFDKAFLKSREWVKENIKFIPILKTRAAFMVYFLGQEDAEWPKKHQVTKTGFYIHKDTANTALATLYRKEYHEKGS